MPSLSTTTVSINKANTKALRELSKENKKTVGTMVNDFVAEKLAEVALYKARRSEIFPAGQQGENCKEAHICHLRFTIIATNILESLGVQTVGDLIKITEADILANPYGKKYANKKRINEIKNALAYIGLKLAE